MEELMYNPDFKRHNNGNDGNETIKSNYSVKFTDWFTMIFSFVLQAWFEISQDGFTR